MKKWTLIYMVFVGVLAMAQDEVLFDKATTAYNEGNYELAIDNYQQILRNGKHSANVYFNLGNSYYKSNQIGPSIYYYEKALLLDPNNPEIRNNLSFAQQMTIDAIEPLPQTALSKILSNTRGIFTFDQWAYIAIGFMALFVALYLSFYFMQFAAQKRIAFIGGLVSLLFSGLCIAMAVFQYQDFIKTNPAIIFAQETTVKEEPNNRSNTLFELHEGTKVMVEEKLNDWNRVRLADGKNGWIPASDLKLLKDF